MDLLSSIRKSGSRGGVNFSWDEVANSNHRENYLGHSLKAPVGRWQKGRDLNWYAKSDATAAESGETDEERQARERAEELRRIKEAEEDAIAKALGLPIAPRKTTGANAVEVGGQRQMGPAGMPPDEAQPAEAGRHHRSRRHEDSERRHRRRSRSRDRERERDRERDRRHGRHRDDGDRRRDRSRERSRDRDRGDERRRRRHRSRSPREEGHERRRGDRDRGDRGQERRRSRSRSREPRRRQSEP